MDNVSDHQRGRQTIDIVIHPGLLLTMLLQQIIAILGKGEIDPMLVQKIKNHTAKLQAAIDLNTPIPPAPSTPNQ